MLTTSLDSSHCNSDSLLRGHAADTQTRCERSADGPGTLDQVLGNADWAREHEDVGKIILTWVVDFRED